MGGLQIPRGVKADEGREVVRHAPSLPCQPLKMVGVNLLIIRHAQSTNNLLYAQTGASVGRSPDPALTDLGHAQARALAELARHDATLQGLTHLYSSLTTRAVQTAAPLAAALGLGVQGLTHAHETQGLFHRDEQGVKHPVVGRSHADLLADCPALLWPPELPADGGWPGGFEARDQARYAARAHEVVSQLRSAHAPEDWVGLVTHGHFVQFLLRELFGHSAAYFVHNNTGNTLLSLMNESQADDELEGARWMVGWVNRHDHLKPEQVTE